VVSANLLLDNLGFLDNIGSDGIREDALGNPLEFELIVSAEYSDSVATATLIEGYMLDIGIDVTVSPILWPILFLKLSTWKPISKYIIHPIQKPWDYVFGKREAFWIIIHLKDRRKIGGKFGTSSFSSSYPSEEQIYLEEVWKLDENGKFIGPIERSKGIIILGKEILSIEFFK